MVTSIHSVREDPQQQYQNGIRTLERRLFSMANAILEQAAQNFPHTQEGYAMATRAQHYRLLCLHYEDRHEEVESLFPLVMAGYTREENTYGQSLLLCHLAVSISRMERWPQALGYLQLAAELAASWKHLHAYILLQLAEHFDAREMFLESTQRLREAAELLADSPYAEGPTHAQVLLCLANALYALGERQESIRILEAQQELLIHAQRFHEALSFSRLLADRYRGPQEEAKRIQALRKMHFCGMQFLRHPPPRGLIPIWAARIEGEPANKEGEAAPASPAPETHPPAPETPKQEA